MLFRSYDSRENLKSTLENYQYVSQKERCIAESKFSKPKNVSQYKYVSQLSNLNNKIIIATGPAGTGKTFIALYKAIEEVLDKNNPFNKIIVVRSAVQSREIGHLPGDVTEKMEIYEQPYRQICETLFGRKDAWDRLEEQGHVTFISTSFIRGMSFDDAIIIVDEMQNMTFEEIDTVMTRVGYRSKIIWCGDYRQTDLNKKKNDVTGILKFFDVAHHMKAFTRIEFTVDDIVRSSLVKDYILAKLKYEDYEDKK